MIRDVLIAETKSQQFFLVTLRTSRPTTENQTASYVIHVLIEIKNDDAKFWTRLVAASDHSETFLTF